MHILAYVDPGLGALIWQSIIGFFVGAFFYLRKTRKWLGGLLRKWLHSSQPSDSETNDLPVNAGKAEADHL
jgi:hypothetical protein